MQAEVENDSTVLFLCLMCSIKDPSASMKITTNLFFCSPLSCQSLPITRGLSALFYLWLKIPKVGTLAAKVPYSFDCTTGVTRNSWWEQDMIQLHIFLSAKNVENYLGRFLTSRLLEWILVFLTERFIEGWLCLVRWKYLFKKRNKWKTSPQSHFMARPEIWQL